MGRVVVRIFQVLAPILALLSLSACGPEPEPRLVRLADLLRDTAPAEPLTLAEDIALGPEPTPVAEHLAAARLTRLTLEIRGEASELVVAWKVLGDRRFEPYRRVILPLTPDGEVHSYEVDLDRNPYWSGTLPALALEATGGEATLVRLVAHPAPDRSRDVALAGATLPALPALARIEIPLPDDLPETGHLRLSLGLLPDMDRPGTTARFRAFVPGDGDGDGDPEVVWLDQTITGGEAGRSGWRPVERQVTIPAGGTLVLEATAERDGRPLPEGVGFWGAPRLVTGTERSSASGARNLLVVNIDTLRADALGSYGAPFAADTPHLDALAGRGVRFATHRAPAPWTLPSVATLLTGLQPQTHRTGIRVGEFTPTSLPESADTLAERLGRQGFVTSGLYNNIYLSPAFRVHQGFDRWESFEETDGVMVDRAIEQLGALGDERFFYYLHLFGPHNPYEPPAEDCARVAAGSARLAADRERLGCSADRRPGNPLTPARDRAWLEALYRAEVTATDRALGRLFAFLEESGRADDTVVLVVSDHGEDFWEHLRQMRSREGYRAVSDHGHSFYEELLAVPGILAGPGVEAGRVYDEPVESVDFLPTVLGLLGLPVAPQSPESGLQGRDLGPYLAGRPPQRPTLLADNVLYGLDRWSVRRGPWKLVVPEGYDPDASTLDGGPRPELYHLEDDPGETDDRFAAEPDVVRALLSLGTEERAAREKRALGEGAASTYLEWNHVTKLRSLGYLQ